MADENSSKPVPEHWKLVVEKKRNGSEILVYTCQETGQKFYTYEDLMRYVKYAKSAKLGVYSPYFDQQSSNSKKTAGSSYVDESDNESSGSKYSDPDLPHIASLELVPADKKASMDKHSGSEEKTRLEEETSCPSEASTTQDNKKKKKKKNKNKNKNKKHKRN
ncbi:hypothetical protein SLE2022_027600 [Rubroshorea leprosula]